MTFRPPERWDAPSEQMNAWKQQTNNLPDYARSSACRPRDDKPRVQAAAWRCSRPISVVSRSSASFFSPSHIRYAKGLRFMRNQDNLSVAELLGLHVGISEQLRSRGIVRGENVPTGDLAEFLFCRSYEWTQANNSEKAFDAKDGEGKRYQIKGRRIHQRTNSRQLFNERPELAEEDFIWGIHILTIENGAECGPSIWQADRERECKGPGWRLEAISGGSTNRRRDTIWAIQRGQQGQFRQWLLAMDRRCALTGETCESVLEAAHIVPAHRGGLEVPSNGILLRADIHRLFDAVPPRFEIFPESGNVLIGGKCSYGSFDLAGARILHGVRERIERALMERRALFNSN